MHDITLPYSQFMKKTVAILLFVTSICFIPISSANAQRIGFGLSFGEGVSLSNVGSELSGDGMLNFNQVLSPPILLANSAKVTISPQTNNGGVVVIEIEAPANADITVTITAPSGNVLMLHETNGNGTPPTLPFQIGWGFWNLGAETSATLQVNDFGNAREVVSATGMNIPFMSATFPMSRRATAAGVIPPPPDPNYTGRSVAPLAKAFLLVYGSVGPVPENAQAGTYEGIVDIHVELSTYNEQP
jgi:hypothetical protein